jgi:hypothetical protein
MNRRVMTEFCLVVALVVGGQVFSQTRLTFKGVNYLSDTLKPLVIDKDHFMEIGEQMGIQTSDNPAFNNMSVDYLVIVYIEKGVVHFHGYGVAADKDGDTMLSEFWDSPAVVNGGKAKVTGGTGKFEGVEGTCDYLSEYPKGWPGGTGRLISHNTWYLTLKKPL